LGGATTEPVVDVVFFKVLIRFANRYDQEAISSQVRLNVVYTTIVNVVELVVVEGWRLLFAMLTRLLDVLASCTPFMMSNDT